MHIKKYWYGVCVSSDDRSPLKICPQIIELLAYALVLSGNHVFTSGAIGTNAATIRYYFSIARININNHLVLYS